MTFITGKLGWDTHRYKEKELVTGKI